MRPNETRWNKVHLSTERTNVTIPCHVRPMYERIDNRDAYIRKLENERHRLWKSICGLNEALEKRYDVGAAEQLEAYKRQYKNVKGTYEYYLVERNAEEGKSRFMDRDARVCTGGKT